MNDPWEQFLFSGYSAEGTKCLLKAIPLISLNDNVDNSITETRPASDSLIPLSGKKLHSEPKNTKENNHAVFVAVLRDILALKKR